MGKTIIDSDVLIRFLAKDPKVQQKLERISDPVISVVTYMELLQGTSNSSRKRSKIKQLLDLLPIIHITEPVSRLASEFILDYAPGYGIQLGDAFIAATAISYDTPLFTYNVRHFKVVPDIQLV